MISETQQQFYDQFGFVHPVVIAWGEMDAFNHLNNVVYYRHAESARIAYSLELDLFGGEEDKALVIAQSSCKYFKPVNFPDTLHIGVRCTNLGTTSMVCEYHFFSEEQQSLVAVGEAVMVSLDNQGNKQAWSDEVRKKILAMEKHLVE